MLEAQRRLFRGRSGSAGRPASTNERRATVRGFVFPPRHGTSPDRIDKALRSLGHRIAIDVRAA